jgi:integrase
VTRQAGLQGLRFHDLRHTAITELAEMGVADHVLESITGHLSRRMLEHYSHIRIDAKRQALDALDV